MARPRTRNVNITAVDQQMKAFAAQLKTRIDALQSELDQLSERYERLTGTGASTNGHRGRRAFGGVEKEGFRQKRIRREGVDVDWISDHLKSKPMTLKQLQEVAEKEGRSSLSVMNVLRANKGKFKSGEGSKDPSQRGRAAQVWSVK